ncbi:hypothetical protein OAR36_06795 [Pseudomonadales bacterium]|nr:hypothetical protein [Pseudomonadales bacterium]
MNKPLNMNLRGKRRVLLVYDVQVDYYKPSAEEKRDDRERGYETQPVEEHIDDSIGEIIHHFQQCVEAKVSKHSDYLVADKDGLFDSQKVQNLVSDVVGSWEIDRSRKLKAPKGRNKSLSKHTDNDDIELPRWINFVVGFWLIVLFFIWLLS